MLHACKWKPLQAGYAYVPYGEDPEYLSYKARDPVEIPSLAESGERYPVVPWEDFLYPDVLRVRVREDVYCLCGEDAGPDELGVPAPLVEENPTIIDIAGEDPTSVVETHSAYCSEIILAD